MRVLRAKDHPPQRRPIIPTSFFSPGIFCQRNLATLVNNPAPAHPFRISQKYGGTPSFRGARSANPESISRQVMRPDGFRARGFVAPRNDDGPAAHAATGFLLFPSAR